MKYVFSILVVVLSFSLVGCGEKENDDPDSLTADELQEVLKDQKNKNLEVEEDDNTVELFPEDFVVVCDLGSVSEAAEYQESGVSPVYVFSRNVDSEPYFLNSEVIPDEWSANWENARETQLVACLDLSGKEVNESCNYQVGGQQYRLELMNASYHVNLFEAATGKIVASDSFEIEGKSECPEEANFDKKVKWDLPDYTERVNEFLAEYVE